jgi:hypothetical protein
MTHLTIIAKTVVQMQSEIHLTQLNVSASLVSIKKTKRDSTFCLNAYLAKEILFQQETQPNVFQRQRMLK